METYQLGKQLINIQGQRNQSGRKHRCLIFEVQTQYGGVAQLGEHLLCKQGVIGSIPFISTTSFKEEEGQVKKPPVRKNNMGS